MNARASRAFAFYVSVLAFGSAAIGADCEGNIVSDPTFRDWCGDALCAWKTDFGSLQRVPTWQANDYGVAFLDAPGGTQISQVTSEGSSTRCILFTSVGNIDPAAQMSVSVDFNSDGSIEYTAPLGTARWKKVQTQISAPQRYDGITFYVKKSGTGTAILAEMAITATEGCTAPAPTLRDLRLGAVCSSTDECASGLLCPRGGGVCGQCSSDTPCGDGGLECKQRGPLFPYQCGPGQGAVPSGGPCVANDDCASGVCDGATWKPFLGIDAGPCDLNAIDPSDAGGCAYASVIGGTCH